MCGFIHSTFVTMPVNLIGLFLSYSAAKEWCASTDVTAEKKPKQTVTKTSVLRLIARPPWIDAFVDWIIELAVLPCQAARCDPRQPQNGCAICLSKLTSH